MYYLYDNSHSSKSKQFEIGLMKTLNNLNNAEVFIENVNLSKEEKSIKDRIWNNWIKDKAEISNSKLHDAENNITLGKKDQIIARASYKNRNSIARIDTGPVFPEELKESTEKVEKAQSTDEEIRINILAKHIAKRDIFTARYISNRCQNPAETVVIMGSTHNLDYLLETEFSIERLNSIQNMHSGNSQAKELALEILKNKGQI